MSTSCQPDVTDIEKDRSGTESNTSCGWLSRLKDIRPHEHGIQFTQVRCKVAVIILTRVGGWANALTLKEIDLILKLISYVGGFIISRIYDLLCTIYDLHTLNI